MALLISARFPQFYKRFLYVVLSFSWLSGIAFFIFSRFIEIEGEFGLEKHPLQFTVLQIHGLAAFLMLMSVGAVFANHIPSTWKTKRHRKSGLMVVFVVSFLGISAWVLYYLAGEKSRELIGNLHAFFGFLLPLLLFIHVRQKRISNNSGK